MYGHNMFGPNGFEIVKEMAELATPKQTKQSDSAQQETRKSPNLLGKFVDSIRSHSVQTSTADCGAQMVGNQLAVDAGCEG